MSEAPKVTESTEKVDKLKLVKPVKKMRIVTEPVHWRSIVDVWTLVKQSIEKGKQTYPDNSESTSEAIQDNLFIYLQQSNFLGFLARRGKRPIGIILAHIDSRSYGKPSSYAFVYCLWTDPQFRGQGVGHALWEEFGKAIKKAGVFHWEAKAQDHLVEALQKETGIPAPRLASIIGGKL